MGKIKFTILITFLSILAACQNNTTSLQSTFDTDTPDHTQIDVDTSIAPAKALPATSNIDTKDVAPDDLIAYAQTLIGVPYKYGSIDPQQGFDCSGFITHVFNRFNIAVPRSSVDFTNVGEEIPLNESKTGDLILFTGTDSTKRVIGHMGIIVRNSDSTHFIHSTSGKAYGVTITPVNSYYMGRFVKTIRIFN
ncbi:MAG: C40 family peptidase [Pyrinomonadaceae bacterium]|nr:C40 family peptidase [Sphingobacteriaceae bacterium]